jgi:hypothetical protein
LSSCGDAGCRSEIGRGDVRAYDASAVLASPCWAGGALRIEPQGTASFFRSGRFSVLYPPALAADARAADRPAEGTQTNTARDV